MRRQAGAPVFHAGAMSFLVGLFLALASLLPQPPGQVLQDWDARRSAAWVAGSPDDLGALYLPGSRAGEYDVALLHQWQDRGLDVVAHETQVLALAVLRRSPDRLVLRVTDRVARLEVDPARHLPRDRARTRLVDLRRVGGEWRVAAVTSASAGLPGSRR